MRKIFRLNAENYPMPKQNVYTTSKASSEITQTMAIFFFFLAGGRQGFPLKLIKLRLQDLI